MTALQLYGLLAPIGIAIAAYAAVELNLRAIESHKRGIPSRSVLPAE